LSLADTGAPAPAPRASLADMMLDVSNAAMSSVANVIMCLKIVGVTSLSHLCLSEKKEVVSVRLLQFGFTTATTWRKRTWPSRGRRTGTAQQPTKRRPLRSPTTSSSVSSCRPQATPFSTRARRRRGPQFRALRASPASSLLFAGESPLMRLVDDSRSLPRCLDTAPTRGRPPPPADDCAAGRPPAGLFPLCSGRHARNACGQAAPGHPASFRGVPAGQRNIVPYNTPSTPPARREHMRWRPATLNAT
jgi:hypothetical protein